MQVGGAYTVEAPAARSTSIEKREETATPDVGAGGWKWRIPGSGWYTAGRAKQALEVRTKQLFEGQGSSLTGGRQDEMTGST